MSVVYNFLFNTSRVRYHSVNTFLIPYYMFIMSYSYDDNSSDSDTPSCVQFDIAVNKLNPYSFQPLAVLENQKNEKTADLSHSRKGNKNQCLCDKCREMETEEESKCCRETNEVPDAYFDGQQCIAESDRFSQVCLLEEVLKTTLYGLNNLRGDKINVCNRSLRYAAYRMFTWWVHNRLGRGVRKVIPSCAIWAIRDAYPETDDIKYVPFQEVRDELFA